MKNCLSVFNTLLHIAWILVLLTIGVAHAGRPAAFGRSPMCEASAALIMKCPDKNADCLVVGDNEEENDLFLFDLQDGTLDPHSQRALNLQSHKKKKLIADIEAMTQITADRILVFGSHSRNGVCKEKDSRRRFAEVTLRHGKVEDVRKVSSKIIGCESLFGKIPEDDLILQAVCNTISVVERDAQKIEDGLADMLITEDEAQEKCNSLAAYNAEGAMAIATSAGTDVWVGLRAPLLAVHPGDGGRKRLAILLHLKGLSAYTFDRAVLVDLGGRGVRDLAVADKKIWFIAGPPQDENVPFLLGSFPVEALNSSEIIVPEIVMDLPTSAEGLAIRDGRAYVVFDGAKGAGKNGKKCKDSSKYLVIALP